MVSRRNIYCAMLLTRYVIGVVRVFIADYPANSNDSYCSSDISMDGSQFDQLDEATSDTLSLQNLDLHAGNGQHNNHQNHTSSDSGIMCGGGAGGGGGIQIGNHNPIDKLYLMQNSYFAAGEH